MRAASHLAEPRPRTRVPNVCLPCAPVSFRPALGIDDFPRVNRRSHRRIAAGSGNIEQAHPFHEERALFAEEDRKTLVHLDFKRVAFDLAEIRVDRRIECDRRRRPYFTLTPTSPRALVAFHLERSDRIWLPENVALGIISNRRRDCSSSNETTAFDSNTHLLGAISGHDAETPVRLSGHQNSTPMRTSAPLRKRMFSSGTRISADQPSAPTCPALCHTQSGAKSSPPDPSAARPSGCHWD